MSHGAAFSELVIEVFRINGLALAAGNALAAPAGLTSARWQILGVVDHAPASVSDVARTMGLTRQGVQQTADAMALDGFVTWAPNPHHQRAKLVTITPKGTKALRAVERRQAAWADRLGKRLGAHALARAITVLQAARVALEEDER
jgi:DNA-binding MarR family transcriptional regulator